ncbi:MAG: HEAT repeat domain-containing protein [Myxococcota bacterium]|nr:HEAT repeat domain-containing protein [Myxococcota bacterium]
MGILDFLFGGSKESQLKRHSKRVSNLNAQAEDREASAMWLAEEGSEASIFAMLKRFSLNYEQRMKDTKEKEKIYRLLENLGTTALEPSKEWMRRNVNFAYPLKLVQKLEGDEGCVLFLLELLSLENDDFTPQKKIQILSHLQNYAHPKIVEVLPPYLSDFNEDVRYAVIETLIAQEDDAIRAPFLNHLANPKEVSNRLKHRIASHFVDKDWSTSGAPDDLKESLPVGFTLADDRIVES